MNIHNTPTVQTQAKQQSSTYLVVGISYLLADRVALSIKKNQAKKRDRVL
jgi:hypothetical protein